MQKSIKLPKEQSGQVRVSGALSIGGHKVPATYDLSSLPARLHDEALEAILHHRATESSQ